MNVSLQENPISVSTSYSNAICESIDKYEVAYFYKMAILTSVIIS